MIFHAFYLRYHDVTEAGSGTGRGEREKPGAGSGGMPTMDNTSLRTVCVCVVVMHPQAIAEDESNENFEQWSKETLLNLGKEATTLILRMTNLDPAKRAVMLDVTLDQY